MRRGYSQFIGGWNERVFNISFSLAISFNVKIMNFIKGTKSIAKKINMKLEEYNILL